MLAILDTAGQEFTGREDFWDVEAAQTICADIRLRVAIEDARIENTAPIPQPEVK
jgi:hypothetical protein